MSKAPLPPNSAATHFSSSCFAICPVDRSITSVCFKPNLLGTYEDY